MVILLCIGLLAIASASIFWKIRTEQYLAELREQLKEIAELREQLRPFAEITKAAIGLYEARKHKHDVMLELQEERNLLAKVKELLKLEE